MGTSKARYKWYWVAALGAMVVALLTVYLVPVAAQQHPDEILLARMIQGEGAGLFENRARVGTGLAHVALNRQAVYSESLEQIILQGFYGIENVPKGGILELWAIELADQVLLGKTTDSTNGSFFVLSKQDLETLGVSVGKAEWSVINGDYELHFFREWPAERRKK